MGVGMADDKKPATVEEKPASGPGDWRLILNATSSPLKLLALMVLVCDTLFGLAAAAMGNAALFQYSLHTFLAIAASVVMIALWSPRSFYGPRELVEILRAEREAGLDRSLLPEAKPLIPTLVLSAGVVFYGLYQYVTS